MTKKWLMICLTATLLSPIAGFSLRAEESSDQLMQFMNRLGALEEENRELRGKIEETQHEISTLTQQMNTLKADVDYRLNTAENNIQPLPLPSSTPPSLEEENKASLSSSSPEQEYEKARAFLEQGDYEAAEQSFASFVSSHPKEKLAGSAQYWLGVTFLVRGQHEKAVGAFAKGYKNYPKSPKAAENLLKLAKSLKALDRKADACTTLEQLMTEYPQSLTNEVGNERKELNCK